MQLALGEALAARRGADRIRGFVDEQRLVAGDEVDRSGADGPGWQRGCRRKSSLRGRGRVSRARHGGRLRKRTVEHSAMRYRGARLIRVNVGPIMDQAARRGHRKRHAAPVAAFRCIRTQVSCVTGMPDGLVVLRRRRSSESAGRLLVRCGPRSDGARADRRARHPRPARHRGHAPGAAPSVRSTRRARSRLRRRVRCRSAKARRSRSPTSSH